MEAYRIVYHGTTRANATKIRRGGFKKGTWFAEHLECAVGYGGEYVFEIALPDSSIPKWRQFQSQDVIPTTSIVGLTRYKIDKKYGDDVLRARVFKSNCSEYDKEYLIADMKKHPGRYGKAELQVFLMGGS